MHKRCGDFGHVRKDGQPCGFFVKGGEDRCQHHNPDKTRQQEILRKSKMVRAENATPKIATNNFRTIADVLHVRSQVVKHIQSHIRYDLRKLDLILKACSGASADHAVKATEKQNELLLALSGHGAGIAMLQRLREAPIRVLPGKQRVFDVEAVIKADASPDEASA